MLGSSRGASPDNFAASPPGVPLPGGARDRRSSRFEVQERIGEGALWIVYRVKWAERGQSVALKALRGAANRHPRLPAALEGASLRWNTLSHPHLAPPLEWGLESGTSFFTSALLSGGSLQSRLGRGPLGGEEAMQLLRSLAQLLHYLHGQNTVHGDIRLRQILFDSSGFPILTDGGHAEALAEAGLAIADLQSDAALFLAPERSSGASLAPSADIYALGATFYAALTGKPPFGGSSALAIAARHRHETAPPPSNLNPLVPREFDALAMQMLAKDPAQRPTAGELERVLAPASVSVVAPAPIPVAPVAVAPVAVVPVAVLPDVAALEPAPMISPVNAPRRQPIDDLVQQTLDDQDEATKQVAVKKLRRRHRWREFRGMVGAILFLGMLIGGGYAATMYAYKQVLLQRPKEVRVPEYRGVDQAKAKQVLAKSGLYMKVVRESYDPKVRAGTVMEGDPEPGREVRAKREVFVTISAGEAPIKMLDFSQLTLDQARTIILQHGMRLGSIAEQFDDRAPRGAIIGQYPEAGDSFSRGQPITLVVSRGVQPKEIDAQNGEFAVPDPREDAPLAPNAPFDTGDTFAPLEPVGGGQSAPPGDALETKAAVVRVNIPKGNGTQLVRIIVRDADGERTVYQGAQKAGAAFRHRVTVSRPPDQQALLRVFVGESLVTEDRL